MESLTPREKRSKAMFGTKDALDVFGVVLGFSIEPPETFSARDVTGQFFDQRAINAGSVRRNLAKLEAIGAIQQVPDESAGTRYQRVDDVIWEKLVRPMVSEEIDRSLET